MKSKRPKNANKANGDAPIQSRRPSKGQENSAGEPDLSHAVEIQVNSGLNSKRPGTKNADVQSKRPTKLRPKKKSEAEEIDISEKPKFDHKKKRKHEKGRVKFDNNDPPSKHNNYHGARMSEILRDYTGRTTADLLTDDKEFEDEDENAIQRFIQESHEKKLVPRVYLAITAVVFLWMSSVGACRGYILLFIPFPSYKEVSDSVKTLTAGASDEREGYFDCVQRELGFCEEAYPKQVLEEGTRLTAVQNSNAAIIENAYRIRDSCRSDFELALDILELMTFEQEFKFTEDDDLLFPPAGLPQCEAIQALFSVQLASVDAMNTAEVIAADSLEVMDNFTKQFEERQAYEENYHENVTVVLEQRPDPLTRDMTTTTDLQEIINDQLLSLQGCLNNDTFVIIDGVQVDCPDLNAAIVRKASDVIEAYRDKYRQFREIIDDFIESVESLIDTADTIRGFLRFLRRIGIRSLGFDTPDLGDLINAPGFDSLGIDLSEVTDFVDLHFAEMTASMNLAPGGIDGRIFDINDQAIAFAASLRGEFDLPGLSFDTLTLIELVIQGALDLPQLISEDLQAINTDIDFFEVETPFEAIVISTDVDFLNGFSDRTISFFAYPDSFFLDLDFNMTNFLTWIITIDVLIRICQSILLFRRYYKMSEYTTPPANVTSEKGTLFKERKNTLQRLVDILGSGLCTMIYTLTAILLVSGLFYLAYTPLYEEFVDGCVANDVENINLGLSDGTMLYRNLDTMAAGFAASKGDRSITQDVDKFNLDREFACSDILQSSVTVRQEHFDTHEDLRKSIEMINVEYIRFDDCVDWEFVDNNIQAEDVLGSILEQFNESFKFDDVFSNQECKDAIEEIDVTVNALHDCSAIDTCQVVDSCNGPDFENIQRMSHNTACTSEFAVHSYLLASLFAVTMFTCLNFARYYFMKGILQVWFEYFTPDMYSYLVSCTEAGTILPPQKIQDGKAGFIELRRRSLDKVLAKFKRSGYMNLFFAFAVNFPWMVFLVMFTRDLEFNEN